MSNSTGGLSDLIAWILIGDSRKNARVCWQIQVVCREEDACGDGRMEHTDHPKD